MFGLTFEKLMLIGIIAVFLLGLTFVGIGLEQRINPRLARHTTASRRHR